MKIFLYLFVIVFSNMQAMQQIKIQIPKQIPKQLPQHLPQLEEQLKLLVDGFTQNPQLGCVEIVMSADKTKVIFNCSDCLYIYMVTLRWDYQHEYTRDCQLRLFRFGDEQMIKDIKLSFDNELVVGMVEHWDLGVSDKSKHYFFSYHIASRSCSFVAMPAQSSVFCKAITKEYIYLGLPDHDKLWVLDRFQPKNCSLDDLELWRTPPSLAWKFLNSRRKGEKFAHLSVDTENHVLDY